MKEDNLNTTLKQEEGHTKKIYTETTTFKAPPGALWQGHQDGGGPQPGEGEDPGL